MEEKEKITLCGDNCLYCPRYLAKTKEELETVARLWYQIGWRDTVVPVEEIECSGCSSHKNCTYHLVECTKEHKVNKCNACNNFPCSKIKDMLERSKDYDKKCQEVCSVKDYKLIQKAFFDKERNLLK